MDNARAGAEQRGRRRERDGRRERVKQRPRKMRYGPLDGWRRWRSRSEDVEGKSL